MWARPGSRGRGRRPGREARSGPPGRRRRRRRRRRVRGSARSWGEARFLTEPRHRDKPAHRRGQLRTKRRPRGRTVRIMRILVTAASRRGATFEIAEAIAAGLLRRGFDTEARRPRAVLHLDGYDAVVLGSAVYNGRWCDAARDFAQRLAGPLAVRPTWLFSSGPLGRTHLTPDREPADVPEMLELTGAESHRVFAGKLDMAGLSFGEKAIVHA